MPAQTDRITTDVLIAAPVTRVWELITGAEHLGRWFGDAGATIDARPGGALSLSWAEHRTVHGRVVDVEPPHRLSWRWLHAGQARAEATPANSTLVQFTLTAEEDGTRVVVVESGFDGLDLAAAARAELRASHTTGWAFELGHLVDHAGAIRAEP